MKSSDCDRRSSNIAPVALASAAQSCYEFPPCDGDRHRTLQWGFTRAELFQTIACLNTEVRGGERPKRPQRIVALHCPRIRNLWPANGASRANRSMLPRGKILVELWRERRHTSDSFFTPRSP